MNGHEEEYIGYAVSTDLLHWDVRDGDCPLLVGSMKPGAWDAAGRTGDPSVFLAGDRWYMAYYSWDGTKAQDGIAWTTREAIPARVAPRGGRIRSCGSARPAPSTRSMPHKPFVVVHNGIYYHYLYSGGGRRDAGDRAGHCTAG